MWKINVSNEYKIYKFTDEFVRELLKWAVQNRNLNNHEEILKSNMTIRLRKMAEYKKYKRFKKIMMKLSNCEKIGAVFKNYNMYVNNYDLLLQGKKRPPKELDQKTLDEIKDVFKYLYESLLESKYFWKVYNPNGEFKSREEIRKLYSDKKVCPYCDACYITSTKSTNMDHFLPISKFPFLSINWSNLVISCTSCNGLLFKGDKHYIHILHPYFDKIENALYFSFDNNNKIVKINSRINAANIRKSKIRGANFVDLLGLNDKYEGVWQEVTEEKKWLDKEVELYFHRQKEKVLNKEDISKLFKETVERRKVDLSELKCKKIYIKLKFDYVKECYLEESMGLIDWLEKERLEMLASKI